MILMWHHPKYYKELAKKRKEFEREQANKRASEQANKRASEQVGGRVGPRVTSAQPEVEKK